MWQGRSPKLLAIEADAADMNYQAEDALQQTGAHFTGCT
jgi:hypothetical protein